MGEAQRVNELIRDADADDIRGFGNRDIERRVHLRRCQDGAGSANNAKTRSFVRIFVSLTPVIDPARLSAGTRDAIGTTDHLAASLGRAQE
jgi:hypothetical protein